jgi:peptidoglycan/xylan/chitin deacetylase (PgdA/CDA1 family)
MKNNLKLSIPLALSLNACAATTHVYQLEPQHLEDYQDGNPKELITEQQSTESLLAYEPQVQTKSDCPSDRRVALTFDDGPSRYTEDIIGILKSVNFKATFYVLGNNAQNRPDVLKKIINDGHDIGNHTMTHPDLTKQSNQKIKEEITEAQRIITEISGHTPTTMRPPYGALSSRVKEIINMPIVLWSHDTLDWKFKNTTSITGKATKNISPGSIILLHDIHRTTRDALPAIIKELKERNLCSDTISKLFDRNELKNSKTYTRK